MNNEQQQIIDEAYENFEKDCISGTGKKMSKEEFINFIKTNPEFGGEWGLKIEERELSLEERCDLGYKYVSPFDWDMLMGGGKEGDEGNCNDFNIPTKLTAITYKEQTIESYD